MILLSTFTSLLAYSFSIPSYLILLVKDKKLSATQWIRFVIAIVAFVFSMWAIIGSGETIVYWGFVLLMAGVPFYALMKLQAKLKMQERAHWNRIGSGYQEEIFDVFRSDRLKIIPKIIAKYANPEHTAIDFGCGTGRAFEVPFTFI